MATVLAAASPLRFKVKGKLAPFGVKSMSARSVSKQVWIWTKKKEVMTAAVERGWNTFIFHSDCRDLASQWASMALLQPLFVEEGGLFDEKKVKLATLFEVSSPAQLENLQPLNDEAENIVVNLLDWQVIPAENIVAAIQGTEKTVFAISNTPSQAQLFLEFGYTVSTVVGLGAWPGRCGFENRRRRCSLRAEGISGPEKRRRQSTRTDKSQSDEHKNDWNG